MWGLGIKMGSPYLVSSWVVYNNSWVLEAQIGGSKVEERAFAGRGRGSPQKMCFLFHDFSHHGWRGVTFPKYFTPNIVFMNTL